MKYYLIIKQIKKLVRLYILNCPESPLICYVSFKAEIIIELTMWVDYLLFTIYLYNSQYFDYPHHFKNISISAII